MAAKKKRVRSGSEMAKISTDKPRDDRVSESMKKKSRVKKWLIPGALVVGGILVAGYLARGFYVSAVVNGRPIYRYELVKELEKQGGKQVLDGKIMEMLVKQEAQKQNLTVTDEEIDQEIANIEKQVSGQGQDLDSLLALQGMDRMGLQEQVRMRKLVEQLVPVSEPPTEEEIAAAITQQEGSFPEEMSDAEKKEAVTNQLAQQKDSQAIDDWLKTLKESAQIEYLRTY